MNLSRKDVRILRFRLLQPAVLGKSGEVHQQLGESTWIDSKPIKFCFDADSRFIRVDGEGWTELVPIMNVTSIMIAPGAAPIKEEAK